MTEITWEVVDEVAGDLQAEILKGLLEAQGIPVWLNQEGAGKAYGLTIPGLGTVQILVPSDCLARAQELLDAYYSGDLAQEDFEEIEPEGDGSDDLEP